MKKNNTKKKIIIVFLVCAFIIFGIIYFATNESKYENSLLTATSTTIQPVPVMATTTKVYIQKDQPVESKTQPQQINNLEIQIHNQSDEQKITATTTATTTQIQQVQIINTPKTKDQLNAQYGLNNPVPDCNNETLYPYTGHQSADCYKDIQKYYAQRTLWVNQQLIAQ